MDTMDDGFMQLAGPTAPGFPNAPAVYHCGCGAFSFADGHVEAHKWLGPVVKNLPYAFGVTAGGGNNTTSATDPDFVWLLARSGCISNAPPGTQ